MNRSAPPGNAAERRLARHRRGAGTGEASIGWVRAGLRATTTVLTTALIFGFVVRVIAALTLSPHVDEPSSVLAAHVVAERGLPILPSGTPYFQGVTLSYLLAPFVWLGIGEIEHLHIMRMMLVVAGTLTLYLCYRLGLAVTGDARVGALMAAFVAIDPVSVQWSGHVRMYGLLQALTIGLLWAFIALLKGQPSWRQALLVVGLYWAAVFTHVGAALLGPAMAVAALVVYRRALLRHWHMLTTLALSAVGPVALLTLNRMFATENEPVRETTSMPFWSFVGANLLAPLARLRIPTEDWQSRLTAGITLYWLVPGLIVAVSTVLGARYLWRRPGRIVGMRNAVIALLAFYWLPILAVAIFTVSPKVRYLLHLHVIGYLFLAVLVVVLLQRAAAARRWSWASVARYGTVAAIVLAIATALSWRLDNHVVQPNYNDAMAYVAERHRAGEPVIITLPPVGYLSIDEPNRDDVYFLAGSEGWTRAERYTRLADDGRLIDYWIGADSIVSTRTLDAILQEHPDAWVVADAGRLRDDWTDASAIRDLIRNEMYPAYVSEGGAVVYRTVPAGLEASSSAASHAVSAMHDALAKRQRPVPLDATGVARS